MAVTNGRHASPAVRWRETPIAATRTHPSLNDGPLNAAFNRTSAVRVEEGSEFVRVTIPLHLYQQLLKEQIMSENNTTAAENLNADAAAAAEVIDVTKRAARRTLVKTVTKIAGGVLAVGALAAGGAYAWNYFRNRSAA